MPLLTLLANRERFAQPPQYNSTVQEVTVSTQMNHSFTGTAHEKGIGRNAVEGILYIKCY